MTTTTVQKEIRVWGFPPEELAGWPADLRPVPVEALPAEGPVVVHVQAVENFRDRSLAHPRPDGRLTEAALYLPAGASEPADAWTAFDAVIQAGDWEALRRLAACPRQFEMAEWAQEVPAADLEAILAALELGSGGAGERRGRGAEERGRRGEGVQGLAPLPSRLPEAVWEHLTSCALCRQAFAQALEQRLHLRRLMLCPPIARLAAHARGQADPWVEVHLPHCSLCRGEVAALRRLLQPMPVVWLAIPLLRQEAQALAARLEAEVRRQAQALAALVNGCLGAGLTPAEAWRAPGAGGALQPAELQDLLAHLKGGRPLTLVRVHRELEIRWLPEEKALRLEALRGEWLEPVQAFRVELRRGEEVVWHADSQEGAVAIPLTDLEGALEAGADALIILAPDGNEMSGEAGDAVP